MVLVPAVLGRANLSFPSFTPRSAGLVRSVVSQEDWCSPCVQVGLRSEGRMQGACSVFLLLSGPHRHCGKGEVGYSGVEVYLQG